MINTSSLIGKKIISLYNCEILGYISKFYFNKNLKVKYFVITNNCEEYVVDSSKILCLQNSSLVIRNSSSFILKENMSLILQDYILINDIEIYSTSGLELGKINNIDLDDKLNLINIQSTSNETFHKSLIFNISNNICLIKDDKNTVSLKNCRPKSVPKPKTRYNNISVSIQDDNKTNKPTIQNIKPTDTNILIDRICKKNIIAPNGEMIARLNSKITYEIVKKARLYGKLYELVKFSR